MTEKNEPIFKEPFAVRVRIPLLTDPDSYLTVTTEVLADSVGVGGKTALWIQLFLRIVFNGTMAQIIGMLGFL